MYKKTKKLNSKRRKVSKKKPHLKRRRSRKLGGYKYFSLSGTLRETRKTLNYAHKTYVYGMNQLGSAFKELSKYSPDCVTKFFRAIGSTVSINRSVKFHVAKCMQKEFDCQRKGGIF